MKSLIIWGFSGKTRQNTRVIVPLSEQSSPAGVRRNHADSFLPRPCVGNCISCPAGRTIPNRNNKIAVVNHIAIAFVKAVWGITCLKQRYLVALGYDRLIPLLALQRPFGILSFARAGSFQCNGKLFAQRQNDFRRPCVYMWCNSARCLVSVRSLW